MSNKEPFIRNIRIFPNFMQVLNISLCRNVGDSKKAQKYPFNLAEKLLVELRPLK